MGSRGTTDQNSGNIKTEIFTDGYWTDSADYPAGLQSIFLCIYKLRVHFLSYTSFIKQWRKSSSSFQDFILASITKNLLLIWSKGSYIYSYATVYHEGGFFYFGGLGTPGGLGTNYVVNRIARLDSSSLIWSLKGCFHHNFFQIILKL